MALCVIKKAYYLDGGVDVICSIYFHGSCYGGGDYLECGFTSKALHPALQYPAYHEPDTNTRITVPGKDRYSYQEGPYETTFIEYEKYNDDEITAAIDKAMQEWILPAAQHGIPYILAHRERYKPVLQGEKIFALLKQTQDQSEQ